MFNIQRLMAKRKTGFTLVEILVVILIIGLLFVFLVPKIDSATDKARETGIKTDFRSYQTAFEAVAREHGGLGRNAIANDDKLIQLINGYLDPALKITDDTNMAWGPGYLTAKKDPWNNNYIYSNVGVPNSNNGFVAIRTLGKDMRNWYTETCGLNGVAMRLFDYKMDATGKMIDADDGCLDLDLENSRTSEQLANGDKIDDYVLGTWYIDGQIFTATAGFTTNIESGVLGTN